MLVAITVLIPNITQGNISTVTPAQFLPGVRFSRMERWFIQYFGISIHQIDNGNQSQAQGLGNMKKKSFLYLKHWSIV